VFMNKIKVIFLPINVLETTLGKFKEYGKKCLEVFAIWVGKEKNIDFIIKDVWIPTQYNTILSYYVPDIDVHKINVELNKKNYSAVAQLHTHPENAFHSCIDDNYSILTLSGSFSIVVPDFGKISIRDGLNKMVVYRLINKKWVLQSKIKVNKLFKIIE